MTTAPARAVPIMFANLRTALMATASAGLLVALAPPANAACVGDGTANTCTLVLGLAGVDESNIATGTGTGGGDTDKLVFNTAGLTLNADAIGGTGATIGGAVRFIEYEQAQVAGGDLTLTGLPTASPATASLSWTVSAGATLTVLGGNALGDASSMVIDGRLNVNESETVGVLSGAATGQIDIALGKIFSANGGVATTFAGTITGAGGFTKIGGGKLILNNGANSFAGPLAVSGGTLEVGQTNAIASAASVSISGGGQLTSQGTPNYTVNGPVTITAGPANATPSRLTGNAIINGDVSSNGGLQPGNTSLVGSTENPGQDMGSIQINGNYAATGSRAYVGMFIDIDAALAVNTAAGTNIVTQTGNFISPAANGTAGTTHDFLNIRDNITPGASPTTFALASFTAAPVGGATSGNGIQVIRIGGTNSGNDFKQGSALNAGAYQYLLKYVANYNLAGDDGYFLQSATRDELFAHAAILSAGQAAIRHCFRDDQRVPDSPKGATYGRAWIGYRQGSTSFGPDTGIDASEDFSCTTGGMDWRMGAGWIGGVSGGFGDASGDLTTPAGVGAFTGNLRVIEAYAAFTSSAFFLNLSGGYTDMDWIYSGALLGATRASTGGFIGSAQAGIGLGVEPIAMKLMGSVNYDGTDCGESCFGLASTEETGLIEAKASLRFDGITWGGSVRPWAQVSYSTVLSDGINKVAMGAVSVTADTNDELLSIDAGMQSYLDQNLALFLDGGYHESLQKDITGYRAGLGLKLYW